MTVTARLFDAEGTDREIAPDEIEPPTGDARRLLWVDVDRRERSALETVAGRLDLEADLLEHLMTIEERPRLVQYPDHIHLSVGALDRADADDGPASSTDAERQELDLVAGRDWVMTVHDGPVPAIDGLLDGLRGETRLGALTAGELLAALVDAVIVGYFRLVEELEQEIDRLDEVALRHRRGDDVLAAVVDLRRRIGRVRRVIAPQREAFAPLGRPGMALEEELGQPWPELLHRLERAIDAVENLRDSLLGTYDIHMGRAAQHANDVMKALTVLSAVLLPAVVLAGLMGMNFQLGFFESPENFWIVVGTMLALAITVLGVARSRGWI